MTRHSLLALAVLVSSGLAGCVIEDRDPYTYESCFSGERCNDAADSCTSISNPGTSDTDYLCTFGCTTDGQCEASRDGEAGFCLSNIGAPTGICVEHCRDDFDCDAGWVCQQVTSAATGLVHFLCLP